MKLYNIRRHGSNHYGERVMAGTLRECLVWLKDVALINSYRMERHDFTFIAHKTKYGQGSKLFRIETVSEGEFNDYLKRNAL